MKNPVSAETFIGLKNYFDLFQDEKFIRAMWNTVILVVVTVPAVTLFSLWVSSAIYQMKEGLRSFFRCVFYLPVVTGTVAVVVVWRWQWWWWPGRIPQWRWRTPTANHIVKNTAVKRY